MNAVAEHAFLAEGADLDPRGHLVASRFRALMEALGLDLSDPDLAGTPRRVARAWREIFAGLNAAQAPELRTFPNTEGYSEMVAVTGLEFYSVCAHHFLPFFGSAHVGYLPGERVVGLSKLARAVEHCARRPQIQERLTEQAIALIDQQLAPRGAIVVVEARHLCMEMRGVLKPGAKTTTRAVRGAFVDDERLRQEFLDTVERSK
jgi:GTP cyclohydrolase I